MSSRSLPVVVREYLRATLALFEGGNLAVAKDLVDELQAAIERERNAAVTADHKERGVLPNYPATSELRERLEICIEHEYHYGGDHRAAAAALVRDIELGYIGVPAVPGREDGFDVGRIADRLAELSDYVTQGPEVVRREFTMRVPAERYRDADLVLSTAASLLRNGLATPKPVSVLTRRPEPWDLRDGKCWWWDCVMQRWAWRDVGAAGLVETASWLPWWAIAMPGAR